MKRWSGLLPAQSGRTRLSTGRWRWGWTIPLAVSRSSVGVRPRFTQPPAQVACPGGVAFFPVEVGAHQLLEVSGLGMDEQLVDRGNGQVVDQAQVDAEADEGEQLHRFFRGHHGGRAK